MKNMMQIYKNISSVIQKVEYFNVFVISIVSSVNQGLFRGYLCSTYLQISFNPLTSIPFSDVVSGV